jgi:hypothetical protein
MIGIITFNPGCNVLEYLPNVKRTLLSYSLITFKLNNNATPTNIRILRPIAIGLNN